MPNLGQFKHMAFHDFYDRLTRKYTLQLNYWRGPIDTWPH